MTHTSAELSPIARVPTGVVGLDRVLDGGLLRGGLYLVSGIPGGGKTVLGNQICFHHVANNGRAIYLTLMTESHARLFSHLQPFAFFTHARIGSSIQYFSASGIAEQKDFAALFTYVRDVIREQKATLLVIDGLSELETRHTLDDLSLHRFLHKLQLYAEASGCTTLLLSHHTPGVRAGLDHTMVDGVIALQTDHSGLYPVRDLHLPKFRGSSYLPGRHDYAITNAGLVVYPRSETVYGLRRPPSVSHERMSTGVAHLDAMLDGGIRIGSITLLFGPTGCGKTLLGLHILAATMARGTRSLFASFLDSPDDRLDEARQVGLDVGRALAAGQIATLWQTPVEQSLDALAARLLVAVEQQRATYLFLDGLDGLLLAAREPGRREPFLTALLNELRARDVTVVLALELPDLFGPTITSPINGLLKLVDTIVFLRSVEWQSQLQRLISILKARGVNHDSAIHEFHFTPNGIEVADTFANAEAILTGVARPRSAGPPRGVREDPRGNDTRG